MGAKNETWVVEVRKAGEFGHEPGKWQRISECGDGSTALAIADAVQNFMRTGLIDNRFHTRTRIAE